MRRIGKTTILFLLAITFSTSPVVGEGTSSSWQRQEKSDPLHNLQYTEFTLEGKYLISPKHLNPQPPLLVVRCQSGEHKYRGTGGTANGKFLEGYLVVDAVLDFSQGRVPIEFRLDDGKLQQTYWSSSTSGTGAFFTSVDFNNLLYGHLLPHKEGTTPPVRKVIVGLPEYLASEIEAEFDMPDPTEVADVCGVTTHK